MRKLTTEEFIKKAKYTHGDKYNYNLVEYINAITKVIIVCKKHGKFKIDGRIYDALIGMGIWIPAKIEAIRFPGTCLILEQKWCDQVQIWRGSDGESVSAMFSLPVGTPIFVPMNGFISNNSNGYFTHYDTRPRLNTLIFYDQVDAGGWGLNASEKFFFLAFGIGNYLGLDGDSLVVTRIKKGEVLFEITESTLLLEEWGTDITLGVFHYKLTAVQGGKEWKNITFGPPFIN